MNPPLARLAFAAPVTAEDVPEIFLPATVRIDRGRDAIVLDLAGFTCSTARSYWNGSAGRFLHFAANKEIALSTMARAWEMVDFGPTRVLHGSACGGYGALGCVEALVSSDGAFRTIAEGRSAS